VDDSHRRPGFTIPGYAAAAAKKNHALGTAYRFTAEAGRRAGKRSAQLRKIAAEAAEEKRAAE
jgi:hypothetical protein